MQDGIVSDEEKRMITKIIDDLGTYSKILDQALADGTIDIEDKTKLYSFRTKIYGHNLKLANEDQHVTEDEKDILITLNRILRDIREEEENYDRIH